MKCEQAPETLISLLYGELGEKEGTEARQHLEKCAACRKILQELKNTTDFLEKWEDEVPSKTVFIQESSQPSIWKKRTGAVTPRHLAWGIPVLGMAALTLLFIFNFQAGYEKGSWHVSFGKSGLSEKQLASEVETRMTEWKNLQMQQLVSLLEESEARQKRDFSLALNEYAKQQELTRRQDLQLVGQGLESLQKRTDGRYYKTSTLINDLIRMSNTTAPQP
jgi:hypothetical protein